MHSALRPLLAGLLSALPLLCSAQNVKGLWDLRFETVFNNGEYDVSDHRYIHSSTLAASRLSPYAGLRLRDRGHATHTLMAGADFLKDFGDSRAPGKLLNEVSFWYSYEQALTRGRFGASCGIMPRHLFKGEYSSAVFSDWKRFYDNNIEGILLQLEKGRSLFEAALDWNGKYGPERREQFYVLLYGRTPVSGPLSAGGQAMIHHFANSEKTVGVVDDIFFNPWLELDLGKLIPSGSLSLMAGPFLSYQRDRRYCDSQRLVGLDFVAKAGYKTLGLRNEAYFGDDMMPFWNERDDAGIPYADNLYLRSPFWRHTDPDDKFYDRAEIYWQPRAGRFVSFRLSAVFHFHPDFAGWQQIGTLVFDLAKLRKK